MLVTLFRDRFALTKQEREISRDALVQLVESTRAPSKHDLPLIKLATFGDQKTDKGALRHDANVIAVHGLEVDYDGEKLSFDDAVAAVRLADVDAILYTSPSHRPDAPRWRVLFPFSATLARLADRSHLTDRANGILGGGLAGESWTLSQAFYVGQALDAAEFSVVDVRSARTLDQADDLPDAPYRKPQKLRASTTVSQLLEAPSYEDLPPSLKRAVKNGDPKPFGFSTDRSALTFYVACGLVRRGWDDEQIAAILLDPEYGISAHCREQGRPQAYALRQAQDAREKVDTGWVYGAKGGILPNNQDNVRKAIVNLGAVLSHNVFTAKGYVSGPGDRPPRRLDDHEVNELRLAIDKEFGFMPAKDFLFDMIDHLTHLNPYHPVVDYLAAAEPEWDGIPRIGAPESPLHPPTSHAPSWLTTYGQAEDTPFTRAVGRLMLVAAVRRVRQPGCKFDEILVLVDPVQGSEKSTALSTLAVEDEWFSDSLHLGDDDRKIVEHLSGKWIIEYAELKGLRSRDVETLKAFLSKKYDSARLAYDRMVTEAPRQSVFFATTNSLSFLKDAQNRRYWPVRVSNFDIPALRRDVRQLWAEAAHAESSGESIRLDRGLWVDAAAVQESFRQEEPWVTLVRASLPNDMHGKVRSIEVWKIIAKPGHMRLQNDSERVVEVMRELGFAYKNVRFSSGVELGFIRNPDNVRGLPEIVFAFDPIDQRMVAQYVGIPLDGNPYAPPF